MLSSLWAYEDPWTKGVCSMRKNILGWVVLMGLASLLGMTIQVGPVPQPAHAAQLEIRPCEALLTHVGQSIKRTAFSILKFSAYPLAAPFALLRSARDQWREAPKLQFWKFPIRFLKREKFYLTGFLTLAWTMDQTFVSGLEMLDDTRSVVPADLDVPIVIVDTFTNQVDLMRLGVPYLQYLAYAQHRNVFVLRVADRDGLVDQLKAIRHEYGRIGLIDVAGHSTPGKVSIHSLFSNLSANSSDALRDVFLPGATLRCLGCQVGRGEHAHEALADVAGFFFDAGGRVVASPKFIAPVLPDIAVVTLQTLKSHFGDGVQGFENPPTWLVHTSKWIGAPYVLPYALFQKISNASSGISLDALGGSFETLVTEWSENSQVVEVFVAPRS